MNDLILLVVAIMPIGLFALLWFSFSKLNTMEVNDFDDFSITKFLGNFIQSAQGWKGASDFK